MHMAMDQVGWLAWLGLDRLGLVGVCRPCV